MKQIGERYGRLVIISELIHYTTRNGKDSIGYWCRCDCGTEKIIPANTLNHGKQGTKSCGCLRDEKLHERTTHGESGGKFVGARTQLYRCWSNIKSRCYNKKVRSYSDYGAKGIKMCDEWLYGFSKFSEWAHGHGFQEGLTINRIDSSKDYCPENCEWIPLEENNRLARKRVFCWGINQDTNEYYEFDNIREFARQHDLNFSAIDQVLHKHNKTHKNWIFGYIN